MTEKMLCVGGEDDGKRFAFPGGKVLIRPSGAEYQRQPFYFGHDGTVTLAATLLVPVGQTEDETLRKLVEGYRTA